ncbi:uncharacterized protein EDB91DRAFT_1108647 [Suillus paluster]|uniref:uncharacterized protein n=1 Tax=Suillus paluster TaxID=48578 RepID=UPI001B879268|nr:uncharacterized protein EDB91DRAFT_1108647 [Suillus paluster]KAG1749600.1 hypothetical protein EDB91DRAFT_1108647 [Suillus paluster]
MLWLVLDNYSIYLDNDLLLKVMSSWPHMHGLRLKDDEPHLPTVTFRGFFAALCQCPHLCPLTLPIDAVNINIDPKAESFQHNSLQVLDVGHSDVADAEAVACIISRCCLVSMAAKFDTMEWASGMRRHGGTRSTGSSYILSLLRFLAVGVTPTT